MTVKKDNLKSKVSVKHCKTYNDASPMLMTLAKQYGLWTDQEYRDIQEELEEQGQKHGLLAGLRVIEKYFNDYIEFIEVPTDGN